MPALKLRPVTRLGAWRGKEFSEKGPNFLNYVQHIFPVGKKICSGGTKPLVTGLLKFHCKLFVNAFKCL